MPRDFWTRTIHGALAGMNGAATMTVLRMLAHRVGLIDQTVPQKVEQWTRRGGRMQIPSATALGVVGHRVLDHALHLGYGATWGGLYGLLFGRRHGHVWPATAFGVVQWAFGTMVLFPALRIGRPPWRSRTRENAVNLGAHLLYAGVTAFLTEEFARQARIDVASPHPGGGRVG
jgi:hypothetical protein